MYFICTSDNHGFAGYFLMVVYRMAFLTSILSNFDQVTLWLRYTQYALICFPPLSYLTGT